MKSGENPLLSICVLSYNQVDEIKRLFDSIVGQITPEIEVFVRDDSTNFDTEFLVKEYSKYFPIRYIHGKKGGIDKTVIFFVEEAMGKYIWWIGDDVIEPDAVQKVINIVKEYPNTDFIWANYRIAGNKDLAIDFSRNMFLKDVGELITDAVAGLGFISATIFKKEQALLGVPGAQKYVGSAFSNLYIVLFVLSKKGMVYFFQDPLVTCYPTTPEEIKEMVSKNGKIKNDGFQVYGINFFNIFHEFENEFGKKLIRIVLKKNFGSLWRGMLVGWVGGWDTPEGKRWKMFKLYWSFPEFWIAIIPFLMPLWINRGLYKIYKLFFSHRRFRFGGNKWVEEKK